MLKKPETARKKRTPSPFEENISHIEKPVPASCKSKAAALAIIIPVKYHALAERRLLSNYEIVKYKLQV